MLSSHNWDIVLPYIVIHRLHKAAAEAVVAFLHARSVRRYLCLQVIEFMAFIFARFLCNTCSMYVCNITKKDDFWFSFPFFLILVCARNDDDEG